MPSIHCTIVYTLQKKIGLTCALLGRQSLKCLRMKRKNLDVATFPRKAIYNHKNNIIIHVKMKVIVKNKLKKSYNKDEFCNSADRSRRRRGVVTANVADVHSSIKKNVKLCNKIRDGRKDVRRLLTLQKGKTYAATKYSYLRSIHGINKTYFICDALHNLVPFVQF